MRVKRQERPLSLVVRLRKSDDHTCTFGIAFYPWPQGGVGVAKIGIITTASADPVDSATFYEGLFMEQYGAASAVWIPVTETSGNADTQEVHVT